MAFTANKVEMWTGEINDRIGGLAATVVGNKFTISLGFDSDADATKAVQVLQGAGSKAKS